MLRKPFVVDVSVFLRLSTVLSRIRTRIRYRRDRYGAERLAKFNKLEFQSHECKISFFVVQNVGVVALVVGYRYISQNLDASNML